MPIASLALWKALRGWLIVVLVLGSCAACSRELSRPKAAELISLQQRLPRTQTITLSAKYLRRSWSRPVVGFGTVTLCVHEGEKYADVEDQLVYYQSKGLIAIDFVRDDGTCPAVYATVTLTDEGKKYLARPDSADSHEVKVFDVAFGTVTGIQTNEQLKAAQVDYTLKLTNITPFGSNTSTEPISQVATFAQFDDGWRIQPAPVAAVPLRHQNLPTTPAIEETRRAIRAAETAAEDAERGVLSEGALVETRKDGSISPFAGVWRKDSESAGKTINPLRVTELQNGSLILEEGKFWRFNGQPTDIPEGREEWYPQRYILTQRGTKFENHLQLDGGRSGVMITTYELVSSAEMRICLSGSPTCSKAAKIR